MRRFAILTMCALLAALPARAEDEDHDHEHEAVAADLHAGYDRLLGETVRNGSVNYAALKKREAALDEYLLILAKADTAGMAPPARLAFWLNAYNAFTLKLVLEHYPGIKSIRDLEEPWKQKVWKAGGKVWSLDQIEHEILRAEFTDPRIHFAIVCASKSCPALAAEAYRARTVDAQLTAAARAFLADRTRGLKAVVTEEDRPVIYLSKLFEWFREDFERSGRPLLTALEPYLSKGDRAFLTKHGKRIRVKYLEYDWSLNDL